MENNKYKSLNEIGKELPFSVPENYFENFALQFEAKITAKQFSSNKVFKSWLFIAAMFVGVFVLSRGLYIMYQNNNSNKHENYNTYVLSQVDEASLMDSYIAETKQLAK